MNEERFQNYEAYFTVLETEQAIDRRWLDALIYDHDNSMQYAPETWKRFMTKGRNGIVPLIAKKILDVPTKYDQLQSDNEGRVCLQRIREYYARFPQGFENCAKDLLEKIDDKFQDFELTRPWRDGGRDALGYYVISPGGKANSPLRIDCALEAKCYSEKNSVGVREMSRLISRIRYRQFGVMLTTSYVDAQAYKEVIEILNYVSKESVDKIPKTTLDTFKANMDQNYNFKVDINKSFEEQELLDETKAIFADIFRDYWATPYEQEKIEAQERYDRQKIEEEKRAKYNVNVFHKKQINKTQLESNPQNLLLEVNKKSFYMKFINFIKNLLHLK
jgi:hypothetical protein